MNCIHLQPSTAVTKTETGHLLSSSRSCCCRLASTLAQKEAPTTSEACQACIRTERPMGLNTVTASLAYAAKPDPDILHLFQQLNKSFFNKPGTALKSLLQKLGIFEGKSCGCDEYAAQMDLWGTEGCRQRISEIVDHLNSQEISWYSIAKVILGGYLTTRSLVEEAITCSEQTNN